MTTEFEELSSLTLLETDQEESKDLISFEDLEAPVQHEKNTTLDQLEQNRIDDYNYIRHVYLSMIESGQISLEIAVQEIKASGHPRVAEVIGALMKQMADVSGQLLEINSKIQNRASEDAQPANQTNIQNNFYGTANDFLEEVEAEEKKRAEAQDVEVKDVGE